MNATDLRIANQVALVTGASSGIGKAIALRLAARNVTLALVGRQPSTLEIVAQEARSSGTSATTYQADITLDEHIFTLRENLLRDFGQVDLLIHSAGVISQGKFEVASINELDKQYRTNLRAPYLLTQSIVPLMKPGRGQIVFINSTVGLQARMGVGQYAATKHGLRAVADSLREEVNGQGLRVLSVFAGRTATPMQDAVQNFEGRTYAPERLIQPDDVADVVVNTLSLPFTVEVTEVRMRPMMKPN